MAIVIKDGIAHVVRDNKGLYAGVAYEEKNGEYKPVMSMIGKECEWQKIKSK